MVKRMKSCCTVLLVLVQDHTWWGMSLLAQGEGVFAVRKGAARRASVVKKVQAPLHCLLHAEAACTERVQWRVK